MDHQGISKEVSAIRCYFKASQESLNGCVKGTQGSVNTSETPETLNFQGSIAVQGSWSASKGLTVSGLGS